MRNITQQSAFETFTSDISPSMDLEAPGKGEMSQEQEVFHSMAVQVPFW